MPTNDHFETSDDGSFAHLRGCLAISHQIVFSYHGLSTPLPVFSKKSVKQLKKTTPILPPDSTLISKDEKQHGHFGISKASLLSRRDCKIPSNPKFVS